ncbi:SRPBCC domain-containing protein [Nonomuraea sp. KM90]|uniref:SRPBCC domain-containing protein n=1 Tax=Nonomuraea sp. KM90 TaxID=3457428 RepID=UPI003FCC60A4
MDFVDEINRAHHELVDGERKVFTLRRRYDAEVKDVWDACTNAERLSRWFLPVTGELKLGGSYQLEGNVGGEILRCEPPRLLKISWLHGENPGFSEVEVRLSAAAGGTLFELVHAVEVPPDFWSSFGLGAVGVGWDLALLGLGLHLSTGEGRIGAQAFHLTEEGRRFITASAQMWGRAYEAAGGSPDQIATTVAATATFYAAQEEQS